MLSSQRGMSATRLYRETLFDMRSNLSAVAGEEVIVQLVRVSLRAHVRRESMDAKCMGSLVMAPVMR